MRIGRRRELALSRYWNALEQGAPAWEMGRLSDDLDPDVVDAVLRLNARDDAREPDPSFVARLEEDLMHATIVVPLRAAATAPPLARPDRPPLAAGPGRSTTRPRGPLAFLQLATAILLALTLGGLAATLFLPGTGGHKPGSDLPAGFASPPASPETTALPAPPAQPATGPGGANYRFDNVVVTNIGGGRDAAGYWLFEPENAGTEPLPVVVFLHDQGEGLSHDNYRAWIDHLVRRGAIVIYPGQRKFAGLTGPPQILTNVNAAIGAALAELASGARAPADPTRLAIVGHGAGGTTALDVAAGASAAGIPVPGAVLAVFPGGNALADPAAIPATTLVAIVAGSGDLLADDAARRLWAAFGPDPVPASRVYLEVHGDDHGEPALSVDFYMPTANEFGGAQIVDALDWYGTWKWLDALMGCAFAGEWCEYVLGDTPEQRFMGAWSDGVPVAEAIAGPPAGEATPTS